MSEIDLFESKTESRRLAANIRLLAGVVVLGIAIAIGVFFVFRFADAQRDRDEHAWQVRLGIVAESRLAAVNEWLEAQYAGLQGLADNTALKLYMTELALAEGDFDEVTDEPAQRTYLRNLLVATADRTGFTGPIVGPDVNANVERVGLAGLAGLALADANGQILVATPEFPPGDEKLRALLRDTPQGERNMRDIYAGSAGHPSIAFIAPIFMLQREGDPAVQIGHAIGIKRSFSPASSSPGRPRKAPRRRSCARARRSRRWSISRRKPTAPCRSSAAWRSTPKISPPPTPSPIPAASASKRITAVTLKCW